MGNGTSDQNSNDSKNVSKLRSDVMRALRVQNVYLGLYKALGK